MTDIDDYNYGKIYKIICNKTNLVYFGSTCQDLKQRLAGHESAYKRYNEKKIASLYITSFEILKNNDYDVILVENCTSKSELEKRESFFIKNNDCINKKLKNYDKEIVCEFCTKEYDTISLLNRHKKENLECLKIQGKDVSINCNYCKKKYSSNSSLKKHSLICKIKLENDNKEIQNHKHHDYESTIQNLKDNLDVKDKKIFDLEKELKDLEKQLIVYKTKCEIYQEKLDVK
jgi:hypothetical protein